MELIYDSKPCGCRGIRICLLCAEEMPNVTYDQQLTVEGEFRCPYSFEEPPARFLNSVNFPICDSCDSSDDDAPRSCRVINVPEPYPEINGVKFPYIELMHPDVLNEEVSTTDEEGDDVHKISIEGMEVEKYHSKKEKSETKTKVHKTDKYAKYKYRHKESKRKIEKRKRRPSSYSSSCDSSESDWSKELNKYRKDQLSQKKGSKVQSGVMKLLDTFRSGSPLRSVSNEEVQSVQFAVENLLKINQEEITPEASPAAQGVDVIIEENASNSKSGSQSITVPEKEIATCELPPSFGIKKQESTIKFDTKAIKMIQKYSSHSEEEDQDSEESSRQLPVRRIGNKKARLRSPDRGREYGRDYKRSCYRSESIEEDRTSRPDETHSNFDDYEENYEGWDENQTFYCEYCLKTMNSQRTWDSHIMGKKHIKAKKLANPEQMASESVPQLNADVSRRLRIKAPPVGYKRVSRNRQSRIQNVLEEQIKEERVLIGLDEVMELIGSQNDYSYYCSLCDAICMANSIIGHLVSFRHKLSFLKKCNYNLYEAVCYKSKKKAEPQVDRYFREVREKPGEIKVFEDVPIKQYHDPDLPGPSTNYPRYFSDTASVISDYSMADTIDQEIRQVEPVTSKGDYFCKVCNSHMNSLNMWESHVIGKRHLKNVNKAPGEAPSKVKFIKSDSPARLYEAIQEWESLDHRDQIICGLDYICERRLENGHELYNCYLCHSNCTPREIIDHLTSLKHMRKYIEKEDPKKAKELNEITVNMSNYAINSLHFEMCLSLVETKGKGKIEVLVPRR